MFTDLIREARELHPQIDGVSEQEETTAFGAVSRIAIETETAAEHLDKPIGRYVTLEIGETLHGGTAEASEAVIAALSGELRSLIGDAAPQTVLVVGLGNRRVTPDALGPRTADKVFVTRHIALHAPEIAPEGMRSTAVFVPGVLGSTGMETLTLVRRIARETKPDAVLCIDALAARRSERIGGSIQMNDSGIQPGAGIGNRRRGLNADSVGVPVIAIGVPLVSYAGTIVLDVLSEFADPKAEEAERLDALVRETVKARFGDLIVTPKEIDALLSNAAAILAEAVNRCLQGGCYEEIRALCR